MPTGSFIKPYKRLATLALAYLGVLSASRLLLVFLFSDRVDATGGLGFILLQGVRFDLILVGILLGPIALFAHWLRLSSGLAQFGQRIGGIYVGAVTGIALFVEASTVSFIAEFDSRPNYLFVEYLQYPKEVFATVSAEHPLQLFLFSVIAVLIGLVAARWVWRDPTWTTRTSVVGCSLATVLIAVLCIAMTRSTLDHRPVNASVAAFSTDALVNQLPLNSPYTVLYALYERHRDQDRNRIRYGAMDEREVLDIVLREAGIEAEDQLAPNAAPTLRFQQASRRRTPPLNLVIILQESLGARFVGSLGGMDLTPRLDALAEEGMFFERLYATGLRSVRGIEAVLTCITPRPQLSAVKTGETQQNLFTLASLLERHGYRTSFIYGGESHFDRMREFFLGNGFQKVVDEKDYEDPVFTATWGVSDEDLFMRAHEEFSNAGDRPFFSLVFTSSNHSPFEIPPGRVTPSEYGPRETAVKYADYAMGQFFDRARESDYWKNTVFLVVADHSARITQGPLVPIKTFRIPGLILGDSIAPQRIPRVSSQIDLLPTLLSLIGVSTAHPCIGRDITRPEYTNGTNRAFMQFHELHAYVEGGRMVVLHHDLPPQTFEVDAAGNMLPLFTMEPALERKALAHALWGPMTIRNKAYFNYRDERWPADSLAVSPPLSVGVAPAAIRAQAESTADRAKGIGK